MTGEPAPRATDEAHLQVRLWRRVGRAYASSRTPARVVSDDFAVLAFQFSDQLTVRCVTVSRQRLRIELNHDIATAHLPVDIWRTRRRRLRTYGRSQFRDTSFLGSYPRNPEKRLLREGVHVVNAHLRSSDQGDVDGPSDGQHLPCVASGCFQSESKGVVSKGAGSLPFERICEMANDAGVLPRSRGCTVRSDSMESQHVQIIHLPDPERNLYQSDFPACEKPMLAVHDLVLTILPGPSEGGILKAVKANALYKMLNGLRRAVHSHITTRGVDLGERDNLDVLVAGSQLRRRVGS